jgi:hypothetical protein
MADIEFNNFVYHGGSSFGIIPYNLQGWFLLFLLLGATIATGYVLYLISVDERLGTYTRIDNAVGKGKRK